jgi:hypothetical protein
VEKGRSRRGVDGVVRGKSEGLAAGFNLVDIWERHTRSRARRKIFDPRSDEIQQADAPCQHWSCQ